MIGWIALALVIKVIILEIYFRYRGSSRGHFAISALDNGEKYRLVLIQIEEMTKLSKSRTSLGAAVSLLDDIGGTCRNALGESPIVNVIHVDVGDVPPEKVDDYLKDIICECKKSTKK